MNDTPHASVSNASPIVDAMRRASRRIHNPTMYFDFPGRAPILFRRKRDGTVRVVTPDEPGQFIGYIDATGWFTPGPFCTPDESTTVAMVAANLSAAAATHGANARTCPFCRQPLTGREASAVGYGRECANTFGVEFDPPPATTVVDKVRDHLDGLFS